MSEEMFEHERAVAEEILRIIDPLLPKGTQKFKVAEAMSVLSVVLQVPMGEFLNLRNVVQDFQRMDHGNQENVRTRIRTKITELKIG